MATPSDDVAVRAVRRHRPRSQAGDDASGEVVINAVAPFGNIDVLVPDGAQVDVGGFTLFGSKKIAVGDAADERVRGRDPGAWLHPLREPQGWSS